jgi:hypothetical protein
MEEWFHDSNDKVEVQNSRDEIAKVLTALQYLFPRSDQTNRYSIPKMHGMTKHAVIHQAFWEWNEFLWRTG